MINTNIMDYSFNEHINRDEMESLIEIRSIVKKALEVKIAMKHISNPLDTVIVLYVEGQLSPLLSKVSTELHFFLGVSEVQVRGWLDAFCDFRVGTTPFDDLIVEIFRSTGTRFPYLRIEVIASNHKKCSRCRQCRADVNTYEEYPDACGRCIINMKDGPGENRKFF